jgi:exonuclease VII large subunit
MKKIANYLIALAVAAFTFTSCEDVPSPFGTVVQPDSGEEVVIEPQGSGTKSDPYNVAGALEFISGLGADVPSDKEIYVKGFVTSIKEQFSAQYGNAQFTMSDTKEGANTFTFFRGLYLGNKKWVEGDILLAEGDEVIVCGKVVNYKGNTPETVQNAAYTYSINGKTEGGGGDTPTSDLGTKDAPITVAKALEAINKLADSGETSVEAYVKGKISKVQSFNSQYKSITYYISDDGTEANQLQIYSGKNIGGADFASQDDLTAGDVVVVKGKLKKFMKNNEVTPEMNQPNEIISITKGGDTPTSDLGTKDAPITVAKALEAINKLADSGETSVEAYVKGKISKVQSFNSQYKSITYYISDDGTEANQLQIYSGKNIGGADFASQSDLTVGDVVVVKGKLKKYMKNNEATPEMNQPNEIITITKGSGGGGGGDGEAKGTGTANDPFNIAAAIAKCKETGETATNEEYYIKGLVDADFTVADDNYKNATFDMVDAAGSAEKFKAFRVYGPNGQKLKAGYKIPKGATVIVCGKIVNYKGNTPETVQTTNPAYNGTLISVNGKAPELDGGSGGGGDTPSGDEITAAFGDLDCSSLSAIKLSDGTTIAVTQEDGKSAPIYHESTKIIRIYARNAMTINCSKKIAKLVLNYDTYQGTAYKGNDELYGEVGSSKITPSKDDATVTFSNVNGNNIKVVNWLESGNSGGVQLRLTKITITYAK